MACLILDGFETVAWPSAGPSYEIFGQSVVRSLFLVFVAAQARSQDVWREIEYIGVGYFGCNSYANGLAFPTHVEMMYLYVFLRENWIKGPKGK
jgi:hypothetical protein